MQNKGLIRLFAILFGIVSIYQLSFTFVANKVEKDAANFAINKIAETEEDYVALRKEEEVRYLDSLANQEVYNLGIAGYTYSEVKDRELNKGLDLKGGINVILQISIKDILKGLADDSKDPFFNKALAEADEASKNSDADYVDLFFDAFEKASGGTTKLSSPEIFSNKALGEEINFQMSNNEVKPIIRRKINESIVSAFEVLRERVDRFGVTQPNIQRLGTSGRILVELPGAKDVDRVKELLQTTAQLEFWETFKYPEVANFLFEANEVLKNVVEVKTEEVVKKEPLSEIDSLLSDAGQDSLDLATGTNPLFDLIVRVGGQGSPIIATVAIKDTAEVNSYLKHPEVKKVLPSNLQFARFAWSKPGSSAEVVDLYALKSNRGNIPAMKGDVIVDASRAFDMQNNPTVSMQMNAKGAKEWEVLTGKAFTEQGNIAIVLDNTVYSAPGVSRGAITGGNSEITGDFTLNEAEDLANVLRAGKLPASANIVQSEVVGPSLGQEAIDRGFISFILAMSLVLIYMIFYYGKAGLFTDIALAFNILLIFGVLSGLGAVLTLPGIAGIVLTIGMAVDANVLIFERIKEELAKGKGQSQAVSDGFGNALSSILDANITTGLTALILFVFGTGPVKGFATTLLIGLVTSMFTAIFVTRLLIEWYIGKKKSLDFSTSITKNLFQNINIDFLAKRKISYTVSGILVLISLTSLFTLGLNQGVDFVGGRSYQIRFEQPVSPSELAPDLNEAFGSAEVKTFGNANQIKVTTKYKVDVEGTEVDKEIQEKLYASLQQYLPDGTSYNDFVAGNEKNIGILEAIKVGPTIADDIKRNAIWAVIGSMLVMFLYILLRFRRWQFSLGAVAAIFHDILIVLGVFSLTYKFMPFNMEINQAFIAAILTVIGYSINDTVVVFDRIREIVAERGWKAKAGVNTNMALNSTLSRTLNTSLTTLVVLLAIFIFGGESLQGFMFGMIIGVIVGTYSSLFIATPVMYDTIKKTIKEEEK